ncbi:MAG: TraB/GumN family protein [Leptospiraceae bacterium]|nr:TraB/GumN family protein [Leptospiraceae bacterium]
MASTESRAKQTTGRPTGTRSKTVAGRLESIPHYDGEVHGARVIVLGTAHVSAQSVEDVQDMHALLKPDAVAVELCAPRYEAMTDPDRWRKLDLGQLVRQKKIWLLMSSLILSAFQKKIGETTGVRPGQEMLTAIQLAEANGQRLVLADREIRITLSRAWSRVGFFSRLWLFSTLLASLLFSEDIEEEEIEKLKQQDVFEDLLNALPPRYQTIREVIIDERDRYLAEKIRVAAGELSANQSASGRALRKKTTATPRRGGRLPALLAVVGAGHLPGIRRVLESGTAVDTAALEDVPRRFPWKDLIGWIIIGLVFIGISALVYGEDFSYDTIMNLLYWWVGSRAIGTFIGALISRAHPLTTLVTTVLAPISVVFGPFGVRLWMIAVLLELRINKPRVEDFENITGVSDSWAEFGRSLYGNRVMHLFFILLAVSWGLTFGNLFFSYIIVNGLWQQWFG